ncbi:OsmC family protein [Actinoplanes sp. NPDC049802]|uniref:OsmC family protein n=1 Tax=Actinoplanes sp. NPDC049802 TaxID=3154742 RepID=UPI003402D2FD
METFEVVVGAGALRAEDERVVRFPHRWTAEGVTVEADFTGAHLLHLAAAGCVLNDVYREAINFKIQIDGVRVRASGGYDTGTWTSRGISYQVEIRSPATDEALAALLARVDEVAEIPRAIRAGASVERA